MRSKLAEALRQEQIEEIRSMTPGERVALALQLGERDLGLFMSVQKVDANTALQMIRRSHQAGRRLSRCMQETS